MCSGLYHGLGYSIHVYAAGWMHKAHVRETGWYMFNSIEGNLYPSCFLRSMKGKGNICCLLLRGIKLKLRLSLDENVSAVKMFALIGFRYDNWFYLSSLRSEILYDFERLWFYCCSGKRRKLKDISFMKVDVLVSILYFFNIDILL